MESEHSTPAYFRYVIRILNRFPNFDQPFIGPLRRKAVALLQLPEGGRALDAGCGTGASFPYLLAAVGRSGEVVGVEISPAVAGAALKRIESNGWENVQVVIGDARTVQLSGNFDGMLMFGAPDAYASSEALIHLMPYLKANGRVVASGSKLTRHRFGAVLNVLLRTLMKLSFASTPKLDFEPWKLLTTYSADIQVQCLYGCFFLASGSLNSRVD